MEAVGLSVCSLQLGNLQFGRSGRAADGCVWLSSGCVAFVPVPLRSGIRLNISGTRPPSPSDWMSSPCALRKDGVWRGKSVVGLLRKEMPLPLSTDMTAQMSKATDTDPASTAAVDSGQNFDVVILSNGPGEVATWVKPVLESLRALFKGRVRSPRISVVLAPCPHASGAELELVRTYEEVDRCQGPGSFWKLLLLGSSEAGWSWHRRGVVVFLGGDQAYALLLGLRLGYRTIVYAEDAVRWPGLADSYMLRSEELMGQVPKWARSTCRVVGDLFSDAVWRGQQRSLGLTGTSDISSPVPTSTPFISPSELLSRSKEQDHGEHPNLVVGLLPGSKGSKLALGVPYFMAAAAQLQELMNGRVRFVLPLAPTATLSMLESYANADSNPFISQLRWASGAVVLRATTETALDTQEGQGSGPRTKQGNNVQRGPVAHLVTSGGVEIEIWQQFPAHEVFRLCDLCLTTVGTNTAELGLLGIPMIVVLPTHALEVFKGATGGILGLVAKSPGWLGKTIAQALNTAVLKNARYIAWPNRWAGEEIVPELVGRIEPREVAAIAAYYLNSSEKLLKVRQQLLDVGLKLPSSPVPGSDVVGVEKPRGGAAEAIAAEVDRWLTC